MEKPKTPPAGTLVGLSAPTDEPASQPSIPSVPSIPIGDVLSVAAPSVPPPASQLATAYIGVTIDGRYKIESILGEGGMGVVYAGRHKVINKRVAIKVLRADMSRDSEMTERFLQEARAASSIGHPHIIDVSDFGVLPDGSAYFIMEFLEGRSLSDLLKAERPLPTERLIRIARQMADALGAAHAQGIVHRDLKPDNVFLVTRGSEKDYVKILDFGIAKVATSSNTKLTRAGTVFGTPHYMSPEQAAGAPVDHRTDLYALGVILYELAAGQVPFDADNYMGILTQHMYKAPVPIRAIVPPIGADVPPGLEAIVLKLLSKKVEQRYESMAELVEELDTFEKGGMPRAVSEMIARSGSFNVPADYFGNASRMGDMLPGSPKARRAQWPLYAGVAGVCAAIGIVGAIFALGSTGKAEQPPGAPSAAAAPPPSASSQPAVEVAPVEPAKPAGKQVLVIAQPIDAEVFQGDALLGKVPVTVSVPEGGRVSVEIKRAGFVPQTLELDGSKAREEIKLVKEVRQGGGKVPVGAPPAAGPKPGGKRVGDVIDPWAK
ncbi:MAG: serine/threonine protein kinase [Polyangiaceae bacterium]|nr:serine/threonine protein kinase [Polyangiaceae bacterium]